MYCETCGEKLPAGNSTCAGCGTIITAPAAPRAASGVVRDREPLSMGQYLLIFLLLSLPLVNIALLFKWSFWPGGNINRRNFARASLVACLIMTGFYVMVYRTMAGF